MRIWAESVDGIYDDILSRTQRQREERGNEEKGKQPNFHVARKKKMLRFLIIIFLKLINTKIRYVCWIIQYINEDFDHDHSKQKIGPVEFCNIIHICPSFTRHIAFLFSIYKQIIE